MRGPLHGHGAAGERLGLLDLTLAEAQVPQHRESRAAHLFRVSWRVSQQLLAQQRGVERRGQGEGVGQGLLGALQDLFRQTLGLQRVPGHAGGPLQGAAPHAVGGDLPDLRLGVAQAAQGRRDRGVDDLEEAAAGQLLELDQGEVRLHAGGVAVHDQADRARGRDGRDLGVAVAVLLAGLQRLVPDLLRGVHQIRRAELGLETPREDGQALVLLLRGRVDGPAVVADHAQHVLAVGREARERTQLAGQRLEVR